LTLLFFLSRLLASSNLAATDRKTQSIMKDTDIAREKKGSYRKKKKEEEESAALCDSGSSTQAT
jgi:hypothetical protein